MSGWAAVAKVAGETFNLVYGAQRENQRLGFLKQVRVNEQQREDSKYRRAVNDAKAAGLHPLFALGTSGSFGGGGQSFPGTGSYAGDGISRIGDAVAEGITGTAAEKRTSKLDAAGREIHVRRLAKMDREIALDDAELLKRASDLKMAEQQSLYWGNPGGAMGAGMGGPESRTFPMDTKRGLELQRRPLTMSSRSSIPEKIEVVGADGHRYTIVNPALGDEVSQFDYLIERGQRALKQIYRGRQQSGRVNRGRVKRRTRRADPDFYGGS